MFEIRPSWIAGGGNGCFVSSHQFYIPTGTLLPFCGRFSNKPATSSLLRQYCIQISKDSFFIGRAKYAYGLCWANWVNSPLPSKINKQQQTAYLTGTCKQRMSTANSELIVNDGKPYIRVLRRLKRGTEVLCRYGSSFTIPPVTSK
jgi:hypothetical protein